MSNQTRYARNAFATMLSGDSIRSSYILVPATPEDRINKAIDRRSVEPDEDQPDAESELPSAWGRFWLRALRRAA